MLGIPVVRRDSSGHLGLYTRYPSVAHACMQDTFARARTRPKGYAKRARDDRVSFIQSARAWPCGRVRARAKVSCIQHLGIRIKYYIFWPINWENINIFE